MPGSPRLVDLVQDRIASFLDEQDAQLAAIAPELGDLSSFARELLAGGKRFRALFCYWGWASIAMLGDDADPLAEDALTRGRASVVEVAASLELFHAAALVHDDIMDKSDLRRGRPSAHRRFERMHADAGWDGRSAEHGIAAALLLGDLLLGWSDELFDRGIRHVSRGAAEAASTEFARMRTEVTVGQYLDMLEEVSWRGRAETELLERAHRVMVYKSAKYSVEAPLALGAALAEGSLAQVASLREFGLPLGVAFQLRDDVLGVFGDESVTGKPAGDDLREGKRTVLIQLARKALPASALRIVDELLGDRDLDAGQIAMLQSAVRDSGALEQVERLIARNVMVARAALEDAPLAHTARDQLASLAEAVTRRNA